MTGSPHTPAMLKIKAACALATRTKPPLMQPASIRDRTKLPGSSNLYYLSRSGDPHAIKNSVTQPGAWTRKDKAELCSKCHGQKALMGRYGVESGRRAFVQRELSRKALLRFHLNSAATCTDCHHAHDVLAPTNPAAPTNPLTPQPPVNVSQGRKRHFAMSGANHLRLKVKSLGPPA